MIYFDNCSTTHTKPKCVIKAINKGLTKFNYNPGRSSYSEAIRANLQVLKLRESASLFFGCPHANDVIITKSCTESINIALRSNPKKNGHIISTIFEHNSILRTLQYLHDHYNISYTLLTPDNNGKISTKQIKENIKPNTYLVAINHVSNVTGATQNVNEIGKLCKENKLIFVVDGAQSAGHVDINMAKYNINYLAISGHKGVFGPQGIGLLLCNKAKPTPLIFGGTGTFSEQTTQPNDLPEGFESGTLSISNIMGLNAGINFTRKNFDKIRKKVSKITNYIIDKLKQIKNITIYSYPDTTGVVSFNINNKTSNETNYELDQVNIATRSGLHCAPKVHEYFNTTSIGMVRIGVSYFNTIHEAKKLIYHIKNIAQNTPN